jgi:ABC-type proline/glycine betaine transport system substrate-binding protein
MSGTAFTGYGLEFKYQSSDSPVTFTKVDKAQKVTMPSIKIDTAEVSTMDSPNRSKQFIATIQDNGEVTVQGIFVPGNASQEALKAQADFEPHDYEVVLPDSLGTYSFTAIVTEWNLGTHELTKAAEFTAKLKISTGVISFA